VADPAPLRRNFVFVAYGTKRMNRAAQVGNLLFPELSTLVRSAGALSVSASSPTPEPLVGLSRLARPTPPSAEDYTPDSWPSRVEVNVGELAARVAGYNLSLRALEADLSGEAAWDAKRLQPLVCRLEILIIRQNDLNMFRDMLSEPDRALVGWLESPRGAISKVAECLFDARNRTLGADYSGNEAQRQAELLLLDALSRKVAEVADR
jgi:hypothetical protein